MEITEYHVIPLDALSHIGKNTMQPSSIVACGGSVVISEWMARLSNCRSPFPRDIAAEVGTFDGLAYIRVPLTPTCFHSWSVRGSYFSKCIFTVFELYFFFSPTFLYLAFSLSGYPRDLPVLMLVGLTWPFCFPTLLTSMLSRDLPRGVCIDDTQPCYIV